MRTFLSALLFLIALVSLPGVGADGFPVRTTGTVVWVADGDTFRFSADDPAVFDALKAAATQADGRVGRDLNVSGRFDTGEHSFLVRAANIDTAESQHPDADRNSAAGRAAGRYAKDLLSGIDATVECYEIGYWGRPICSLWTEEFELGTHLIEQGYTEYETEYGRHPTMDAEYRQSTNH